MPYECMFDSLAKAYAAAKLLLPDAPYAPTIHSFIWNGVECYGFDSFTAY